MTLDSICSMPSAPQTVMMASLHGRFRGVAAAPRDDFSAPPPATEGSGLPMATITIAHSSLLVGVGLAFTLGTLPEFDVRVWDEMLSHPLAERVKPAAHIVIGDLGPLERLMADGRFQRPSPDLARMKFVLMTASGNAGAIRTVGPITLSACLSVDCQPEDLVSTVRGLCCRFEPSTPGLAEPRSRVAARGGLAPGALRRVREHIHSRLADRIQLRELAAIAELSDCHFSRAFKQSMGVPPHRYVMQHRIEVAARLIEQTDRPLSEIALEVGFSDQSHFTRMFSRLARQTPRDYRHHCR